MDKKSLSERDICSKFIAPAITAAGWDLQLQIREEVKLTSGRVIVHGNKAKRDEKTVRRADFVLYHKPGIPLAVIEAKDNKHTIRDGIQQALDYAAMLDVPFAFSSNGDGFVWHDKTAPNGLLETEITLDEFPPPELLWQRYMTWKGITSEKEQVFAQDYYTTGKPPRYYQSNAINRAIEAYSKGQQRILLVMATGTGKTFTAFQIIWRLWRARAAKRILFLADRNILVDQTKTNDFKPFGGAMTKISNRQIDKSYEIYLSLYQAVSGTEETQNVYKDFSPDFFDLIVIDECHRGSAAEDSAWREILEYFSSATHLGLTATPKETEEISNISYFGEPVYTYSLKQGIEDGFLAPYKVVRIDLDKDLGWRPTQGKVDAKGQLVEDRIYNASDMNKTLVLTQRDTVVAQKITDLLKAGGDRMAKTIVFCEDIDHAARMRQALVNANADLAAKTPKYVMQITGDNEEGKLELDNFIDPKRAYPVIATTSRLMTTGVDAQTCKLVVLDRTINSMTEFKQIIGRGTRINEDYDKLWFTILDFKKATELFADPDFDGEPVVIYQPGAGDPPIPPDEPPIDGGTGSDGGEITGGPDELGRIKYLIKDARSAQYHPRCVAGGEGVNAVNQVQEASAVYAVEQHVLLKSFDLLATAPEGVARLRELILSMAVQGTLVPQDPKDEPASVLLERIRTEKQKLIKEGTLKKDKPLAEISEEEKSFELPQGWEWERLGGLGQIIGGGTPKSDDPTLWADIGIRWLTPADLYGRKEKTISSGRRDISEKGLKDSSAQLLPAGTSVCRASF